MTAEALLRIEAAGVVLEAERSVPEDASGVVVVADGARRTRMSRRHREITGQLNTVGLATILLDTAPGRDRLPPDTGLVSGRLAAVLDWAGGRPETAGLPCGLLCSGTAVAAGLLTAARRIDLVRALVGWDGRPNVGVTTLVQVAAPTLLAVDSGDQSAVQACEYAAAHLAGVCKLHSMPGTVPGENGERTEAVGRAAAAWFGEHFRDD
ncbi:MAG TPA: hypothetical protein VF062_07325 [Candidatus Limnocylindrales bacterium]